SDTRLMGAAGAIDNSPDSNLDVTLTLSSIVDGQSTSVDVLEDGSFDVLLPSGAAQPFNLTAMDDAGNMNSVRVQLGTACYTDSSTHDTQLTVAAGSGTVTGPNGS